MKKYIFLYFIFLNISFIAKSQILPDPAHDKSWKDSVFAEEFDYLNFTDLFNHGLSPNGSKWFLNIWGDNHDPIDHNEKVYWASDNTDTTILFHPDGSGTNPDSSYMRLYLKKKNKTVSSVVYNYLTTILSIASADGWKYGYIEMSYRLPDWTATKWDAYGNPQKTNLAGCSNALWMYEQDKPHGITWSEIDLFEDYNGFNRIEPNVHYYDTTTMSAAYHAWDDHTILRTMPDITYSNSWHTVSMDWTPDYVNVFYDGVASLSCPKYANKLVKMGLIIGASMDAYFDTSHPDSALHSDVHTQLPYYMDINHIKVWKLRMDSCNGVPTVLNKFDPATYAYGVKKSIEIKGNGQSTISSGQKVTLRFSDYILIDKNFEAQKGAVFEILPDKCQ